MGKIVKRSSVLQKRSKFGAKADNNLLKKQKGKISKKHSRKSKHTVKPTEEHGILFSQFKIADELSRLDEDSDNLETTYEQQKAKETGSSRYKLPIKTKKGVVPVIEFEDITASFNDIEDQDLESDTNTDEDANIERIPEVVTATQLFGTQNKLLEAKKVQVGSLSSSILENPNEKLNNFKTLFNLINEPDEGHLVTVKKLIIVSLLEVFKDLLPSYEIKQTLDKNVKLKKDTLKLEKYEISLLQYYKKFLQMLETMSLVLIKKQGKVSSKAEKMLGELSISALCDLLHTHPYFNYSENIAQTVIPFLNNSELRVRQNVNITCKNIIKDDKKGEITLKILRLVNQNVKKHSFQVHSDMIEILLHLNVKDINMDQERENKLKQKKLLSHKGNVMQLSKHERKKKSHLQEVEKALLEVKAEESKQNKQKCHTEIMKIAFGVFLRILKSCTNTKLVGICLQGISKYSQYINVEFYVDLIKILDDLLKNDWLNYSDRQRCIQSIFVILNEQEILNLDPVRFYTNIYEDLLIVHASKNYNDFAIVLETLICSLLKRHKKVTTKRMASFLKRMITLSLQLLHNGSLACLGLTKSLLQLNKGLDVLLDVESSVGEGRYVPELGDPEYCNASSTALFELALLNRHYHSTVIKYSKYIAQGAPLTSDGNLSSEFSRTTADQLFHTFDMSEMCFCPVIQVVKKVDRKSKLKRHTFVNENFKAKCMFAVKKNCKMS